MRWDQYSFNSRCMFTKGTPGYYPLKDIVVAISAEAGEETFLQMQDRNRMRSI